MIDSFENLTSYDFVLALEAMDKEQVAFYADEMYWHNPIDEKANPLVRIGKAVDLFQDLTVGCLRFNRTSNKFWTYKDGCWHDMGTDKVTSVVRQFGDALVAFGKKNERVQEAFVTIGSRLGGVPKAVNDFCSLLKSSDKGAFFTSDLDQEDNLINLKNATFDLKNLTLLSQSPLYLLSKQCNVDYNPEAKCPRWIQFINEITVDEEGNPQPDKVLYLQKLMGLCLTTNTDNQFFHIFYGATTRNGKTTLANVLTGILGTYAAYIPADTLDAKTRVQPNAPRTDLVAMAGARAVIVGEPQRDMKFDASLIKQMTGRSPIPVRRPYEGVWYMRCQCKLILDSNYLPKVTDETLFTSNRIRIIPFERHFETSEQDPQLQAKLEAEYSGIFNWMLEGLKKYNESIEANRGITNELLPSIECMKDYEDAYEDEFRRIDKFVSVVLEENGIDTYTTIENQNYNVVSVRTLYGYYKGWCKDECFMPMGFTKFKEELAKGFKDKGYHSDVEATILGQRKHFRNVLVGYVFKADADYYYLQG